MQIFICKIEIEISLYHTNFCRVTFINSHAIDPATKKSIPGHECHEVGPLGYHVKLLPLLVSRPHMPQQLWEDWTSSTI